MKQLVKIEDSNIFANVIASFKHSKFELLKVSEIQLKFTIGQYSTTYF